MALLGPNGAGKSTLIKIISGQKKPTSGDVHLGGVDVQDAGARGARPGRALHDARGPLGVPEPHRRGEPHADVVRRRRRPPAVLDTAFSYFPRLHERRDQLAGTMSGGEQQMLAMSRALASDPALLLLDELSMGLAPLIVDELYETVAQIAASGVSILCIEQFARTALRVADYAAVMSGGRVVATGEPAEILDTMSDVILGGAA